MSKDGYISLHRKIQDNWLWKEKRKFSKFEAWVDLLMMVNHKDNKIVFDNELIEVKRGQTITSIRKLCERWNWSNTKVSTFLNLLKSDEMCDAESDAKKTVITIYNYDLYQNITTQKTTQIHLSNDSETSQKHTNNNDNKENNDNNKKIYTEEFEILWELYPKKNNKQLAYRYYKRNLKKYSYEEIKLSLENYLKDIKNNNIDSKYYIHGSNFFSNRFIDYLNENYNIQENKEKKGVLTNADKLRYNISL